VTWTESLLTRLRELTGLGLSASRIAQQLETTKGAVSGARFRHAIVTRPQPKEPSPAPPEAPSVPDAQECRYILDAGPWRTRPPQWCREPVLAGSVYCRDHHLRCYAPKTRFSPAPARPPWSAT